MHQMLAHNANIDPEIFTTHFVDGLRGDIRSVVLIQRPPDMDYASFFGSFTGGSARWPEMV